MATLKKDAPKNDPNAPLNLVNDGLMEIGPKSMNQYAQNFSPGNGEVVIRFKNLTREKKYFKFTVTEVDAKGVPLGAKVAASDSKIQ